jgi:hypothetical protein
MSFLSERHEELQMVMGIQEQYLIRILSIDTSENFESDFSA